MQENIASEDKKQNKFLKIYDQQYKKLLLIPLSLLILALVVLGVNYSTTGSFVDKDVSLKGGITITVPSEIVVDITELKEKISKDFPDNDIGVRALKSSGNQIGFIIDADIDGADSDVVDKFLVSIEQVSGLVLNDDDYSIEFVGSSLGASFFKELIKAIIFAFILMAIVVFIYFRKLLPSLTVVFSAFSDLIITLGIVSLLNIKLSSAGIAAFLMLIGYSVDTNILLSNKVMKTKEGTILDRILVAMKTGIMMTSTTLAVIIVAIIFTDSEVIRQIMIILLIGLLADLMNTWIMNAGLLRYFKERKIHSKNE